MIKNKKVKQEIFHYTFFPKSRKGSHVSFIISFVLFISFLIFFIGILNPFERVETGKNSLLKHLENKLVEEASGEVMIISALEDITAGCGDINALNIGNYAIKQEANFLKIYSSDKFAPSTFSCDPAQTGYKIGLIRTQNYVFKSKILELNKSYEDNYETLKGDLGIPGTNNFEFSLLDTNKNSIVKTKSKETPQTEVLAGVISITYFNETSEIENGYIRVVLW